MPTSSRTRRSTTSCSSLLSAASTAAQYEYRLTLCKENTKHIINILII